MAGGGKGIFLEVSGLLKQLFFFFHLFLHLQLLPSYLSSLAVAKDFATPLSSLYFPSCYSVTACNWILGSRTSYVVQILDWLITYLCCASLNSLIEEKKKTKLFLMYSGEKCFAFGRVLFSCKYLYKCTERK